jgi:DNA modification methylase
MLGAKKIEMVSVDALIPYAKNARTHSDEQVAQIAGSIKEFGFNNPVLIDKDNSVIAGHGRLMAARKLGYKEVPVVKLEHLTESQRKAYILADNRIALNSGWDTSMLSLELQELKDDIDLSLLGFDADELDAMLNPIEETEGLTDEDSVPEVPVEPKTKLGDIYILGNHRLMCGDSTSIDAVEKLMDGQKADMVFTDPPYNINYQDMTGSFDKIKNDKMSDEDFLDFLMQTIMPCDTMYVCCSWQYAHIFKQAMTNLGYPPKAMIVWNKVNPAQNLDKYFKQHEIIWYYGEFGGQKTLRGDIWEVKRQRNTVHPTMKPIELIDIAIQDQPTKRVIYDAFGGSGSTLISAEKNGRKARVMELDPKYCDVIVKRWEDFTGKKAELSELEKAEYAR